jgi:hypothetical protein
MRLRTEQRMTRSHVLLHCTNGRLAAARREAWGGGGSEWRANAAGQFLDGDDPHFVAMSVKALLHYVLEEVAIDGEEGASNCLVVSLVVS